jgi:hypothetical protein
MHQSSRQNKNITYKKYDSKSIKKGKNISVHRSLRLLSDLERRLDLTLDFQQGFICATTIKPEYLQVENYKMSVVFDFHHEEGIDKGEWDLHRLGEVGLAPGSGRVVADRPDGATSTDSNFSSCCRHVANKAQAEPPQHLADRPAPRPTRPVI